jgi:hypothetical protein
MQESTNMPSTKSTKRGRPFKKKTVVKKEEEVEAVEAVSTPEPVVVEAEPEAPANLPQAAPKPKGIFGMLAETSKCRNPNCVRPILTPGNYVYSIQKGDMRGKVFCTVCACKLHDQIKLEWEGRRNRLVKRCGEKAVKQWEQGVALPRRNVRRIMARR